MTKKWTHYTPGQRIETADAAHTAVDAPIQAIQAISKLILGDEANQNYVVTGFDGGISGGDLGGTFIPYRLTVTRGTALVGFRHHGEIQHGMVLSGGPAQKTLPLPLDPSFPGGIPRGVFVCFQLAEGDEENRLFWNPLEANPAETPRLVPTRLIEDWAVMIAQDMTPPGPEWLLIGSIVGDEPRFSPAGPRLWDTSLATSDADRWGSDADRTGPIRSLRKLVLGLQSQIGAILGESDWRARISGGGFLLRNGARSLIGNLLPDSSGSRDLGSSSRRFRRVFAGSVDASSQITTDRLHANRLNTVLRPGNHNATLGAPGDRFGVFASVVDTGSLHLSLLMSDLIPNGSLSIGGPTDRFGDVFCRRVFTDSISVGTETLRSIIKFDNQESFSFYGVGPLGTGGAMFHLGTDGQPDDVVFVNYSISIDGVSDSTYSYEAPRVGVEGSGYLIANVSIMNKSNHEIPRTATVRLKGLALVFG